MAANDKFVLTPWGVFELGSHLKRLDWALATVKDKDELAKHIEPFREYSDVLHFEDIGARAAVFHEWLLALPPDQLDKAKKQLRPIAAKWEMLIQERLGDLSLITPQCKLQPKVLMNGPAGVLPESSLPMLRGAGNSDLSEACLCILVGSPTAAEFMALRVAEGVLRQWYEQITGKKIENMTWGAVLDQLENEYPIEKERPKEIRFLGYLRLRRNEVAHPDRVTSGLEAEKTLMTVCSLICGMEKVMPADPSAKRQDASGTQ